MFNKCILIICVNWIEHVVLFIYVKSIFEFWKSATMSVFILRKWYCIFSEIGTTSVFWILIECWACGCIGYFWGGTCSTLWLNFLGKEKKALQYLFGFPGGINSQTVFCKSLFWSPLPSYVAYCSGVYGYLIKFSKKSELLFFGKKKKKSTEVVLSNWRI